MRYIIILLITLNLCHAGVTNVKKGQTVPHDGYLFTPEAEKENRTKLEKAKITKRENITLKELQVVNEQRIDLYKNEASKASSRLSKARFKGNLKGTLGFVLGTVITGVISYGVYRAALKGR